MDPKDDGEGSECSDTIFRDLSENHQENLTRGLTQIGVPLGLARVLAKDDMRIGMHIYLLDNSGSMNGKDGTILQGTRTVSSTRWEEVCSLVLEHAKWNLSLGTPCEFCVLNCADRPEGTPPKEGVDHMHIDKDEGSIPAQLQSLSQFLQKNTPHGVTPLTDRVKEIQGRVSEQIAGLIERNQIVFLTIFTDGYPTSIYSGETKKADKDQFAAALKRICAELPLQLVIRLCTNDENICEFYHSMKDEELPLDVLGNAMDEAAEISEKNNWFVYTPLIQHIREAGTLCNNLKSLDEKKLTAAEMKNFFNLMSSETIATTQSDAAAYLKEVKRVVERSQPVFDPISKRMKPFVDVNRFDRAMFPRKAEIGCLAWCS